MEHGTLTQKSYMKKIDDAANMWNKTKDPKYKDLWYKLVKEFANDGLNTSKRRVVSVSSCYKRDDGGYIITGQSKLL